MNITATLKNFNMPATVAVTTIGQLTVSTVNLNDVARGSDSMFETCVFYPNGHSMVVGRYTTEAQALRNHAQTVTHEVEHIVARRDLHVVES